MKTNFWPLDFAVFIFVSETIHGMLLSTNPFPQAQGRYFIGEGPMGSKSAAHFFRRILPSARLERSGSMATGKVKWFNDQKGFGFIASEMDAKDVFVHHSVIESQGFRTLQDGETVEYEAEDGPKGLKATKVKRTAQLAVH